MQQPFAAGCHLRGSVRRRAAPTLRIRDPHKDEKMAVIHKALDECSAEHLVFYEDEVDIHLNPKIGASWQLRGQQKRVVTPAEREILSGGALHSGTVKLATWAATAKFSAVYRSAEAPESHLPAGENNHADRR